MHRLAVFVVVIGAGACTADHPAVETDAAPSIDARGDTPPPAADAFVSMADTGADAPCAAEASVCTAPTRHRHCVGGSLVEEDCPASSPDCDARTGACAATACGDHVIHPDEQCDGDNCWPDCVRVCFGSPQCADLPGATSCVGRRAPDVAGDCVAPTPSGAPDGAPCASDADCASSWCEAATGHCTSLCVGTMPMPAPMTWCRDGELTWFAVTHGPDYSYALSWHTTCAREADCADGRHCTVVLASVMATSMVTATCLSSLAPTGSALGAPCGAGCESNDCIGGICTLPCTTDTDCPTPFAHCVDHDYSDRVLNAVQRWAPRICVP